MLTAEHIKRVPAALTAAEAGDWAACSAAMVTKSITLEGLRISGKQTILGLLALQRDPDAIRLSLEATPSGRGLLDLLPGPGVNWVDPLTLAVLEKNKGDGRLSQADVDALKSLSARVVSPAHQAGVLDADCTAEKCSEAWALGLKKAALDIVTDTAAEAAREEYRKADSTPQTIVAAAVAVLGGE